MNNTTKMIDACKAYGVQPDAARMRFRSLFPQGDFDRNAEYAQAVIDAVFAKEIGKAGAKKSDPQGQNIGEAKREKMPEPTRKEPAKKRTGEKLARKLSEIVTAKNAFRVLMAGVVLSHCFVIVTESSALWGLAGLYAGIGILLVNVASLVLSLDNSRAVTSFYSVLFCGALDCCAGYLHYRYFNTLRPDMIDINTGLAVVLAVVSFACVSLFRDVNID